MNDHERADARTASRMLEANRRPPLQSRRRCSSTFEVRRSSDNDETAEGRSREIARSGKDNVVAAHLKEPATGEKWTSGACALRLGGVSYKQQGRHAQSGDEAPPADLKTEHVSFSSL